MRSLNDPGFFQTDSETTHYWMIKVLVVEDSPVARELITEILRSDPAIQITAVCSDGIEAIEAISRQKPDVITMDINMPKMNGLEATRLIMETTPVPIIVVSASFDPRNVNDTFRAVEAGAVAIVEKPAAPGTKAFEISAKTLLQTVRLMSEIKVIRRHPAKKLLQDETVKTLLSHPVAPPEVTPEIVAIGASTGGPNSLAKLLSRLPEDFPLPIVVVQHITSGFTDGLAEWLNSITGISVKIASQGEYLLPGRCYLAPDNMHMRVAPDGIIVLSDDPPVGFLRPAVSVLFSSVLLSYGNNSVAILLSGMGKDGADELLKFKQAGALTIAQDKDSSVVFGMPGEAERLNAASFFLPPEEIGNFLVHISK